MRGSVLFKGIVVVALVAITAGCRSEPEKLLQHTKRPALPANAKSAKIPAKEDMGSVGLTRISIRIPTGTSIGRYRYRWHRCADHKDEGIYLKSGRFDAKDSQFQVAFHDGLDRANFNVVGDPSKTFRVRDERAEYLVAAEITHISVTLCDRVRLKGLWVRIGAQDGSGSISVNWRVYSTLTRKVVYRTSTDGTASLTQPTPSAWVVLIHKSFADAIAGLAADPKFAEALKPIGTIQAKARDTQRTIGVRRYPPFVRPFQDNSRKILRASVTIESDRSHGSGFFITRNGLLLTNQHVVGAARNVRVKLMGGATLRGTVLRLNELRDVALVRVDADGTQPLPIREKPVEVGEEVFAIGTPLDPRLTATVTKGVVSSHRRYGSAGLPMIQADVDVHGGSSGGPLMDRFGNVVGVTVQGLRMNPGKKSVGLNLFIPIGDALKKLNLVIEKRGKRLGARARGG